VPRWASLAGLGFVALFVAGDAVYGGGAGSHTAEITAYYASHANRLHQLLGFALIVPAAVLLAVFASGFASSVALVSGGVSAALLLVANALWAASALTIAMEPEYRLDPSTHLLFEDVGFACFISAAAAAIPLVLEVSLRTSRWFALYGIAVAGALATSYFYFPFFAFLAWVAVASVAFGSRRSQRAGSRSTAHST
jgi:hypothetical protein